MDETSSTLHKKMSQLQVPTCMFSTYSSNETSWSPPVREKKRQSSARSFLTSSSSTTPTLMYLPKFSPGAVTEGQYRELEDMDITPKTAYKTDPNQHQERNQGTRGKPRRRVIRHVIPKTRRSMLYTWMHLGQASMHTSSTSLPDSSASSDAKTLEKSLGFRPKHPPQSRP